MPVAELRVAGSEREVREIAAAMLAGGGRIAVKLLSRDVAAKPELGGVVLGVATRRRGRGGGARRSRSSSAPRRPRRRSTASRCSRWSAAPMATSCSSRIGRDAVFGPVIVFGAGGLPPELLRDTAIELPPLDSGLAAALVARTRVGRLLAASAAGRRRTSRRSTRR